MTAEQQISEIAQGLHEQAERYGDIDYPQLGGINITWPYFVIVNSVPPWELPIDPSVAPTALDSYSTCEALFTENPLPDSWKELIIDSA